MAQWICHNCGSKNDISEHICKGTKKRDMKINSPGGKCFKKRQTLDRVIGEDSND